MRWPAMGDPTIFGLVAAWLDHRTSRKAHAYLDHTKAFRAKLVPYESDGRRAPRTKAYVCPPTR